MSKFPVMDKIRGEREKSATSITVNLGLGNQNNVLKDAKMPQELQSEVIILSFRQIKYFVYC